MGKVQKVYTKMQSYLKTEKTLLPLDADGTYTIYEWYGSDSGIPVFPYQCNLRTYLLTKEMLDLSSAGLFLWRANCSPFRELLASAEICTL